MYNKILKISTLLLILISVKGQAQLSSFSKLTTSLSESNYFLDASLFGYKSNNLGKLLGFPRTDITKFKFNLKYQVDLALTNDYYFDGVLAFNSSTGTTPDGQGKQVKVTPGFYYFSNPKGGNGSSSLNTGQWKKLGGQDVTAQNEMETNLTIDGDPVYSYKGSFTADGSSTLITLNDLPAATANAITSLYRVTIYNKDKKLFTNTIFSFDAATRQIVTGAPSVSVVYEPGNYNYILEYLK